MKGVVAGVRDYGNRMGIPTVNGAVCFDPALPRQSARLLRHGRPDSRWTRCDKEAQPGDLIVAIGGRTGRDGIHGATFSSVELTAESENVSGGAVQIGNAITEKKVLDVILQARDRGLYHAITDCGAGGFSSAVGEMGEELGAAVDLDKAPLKYAGPVVHRDLDLRGAGTHGPGRAARELGRACGRCAQSEDVEATVPRHLRADRPAAAPLSRRSRSPTSTCTSCTTAGRRWCAQATLAADGSPDAAPDARR